MRRVAIAAALTFLSASCAVFRLHAPVKGVQLAFEGNTRLSVSELEDAVKPAFADVPAGGVTKSTIDDAAFEIESAYFQAGFPFVEVHYDFTPETKGPSLATFHVSEGPHTRLATVNFRGNASEKDEVLERFFRADGGKNYVAANVERACVQIEDWYRSQGWIDAVVERPKTTFIDDRTHASVDVEIKEGVRHHLTAIDVASTAGELPLEQSEIDKAVAQFIGEPFSERQAQRIRGIVEDMCADRGYASVKVSITGRDVTNGSVHLHLGVEAGPRVRIGQVTFEGLVRTRESFMRARSEFEPGEWYSRTKERETSAQLFRSGIFDRVRITGTPKTPDASETISDYTIAVVEGSGREVYLEPGYGSYERLRIGGGAREKNLFGTGRVLDASGSVSQLAQSGTLSLIDPWILGNDTTANATLFGNRRQEPSFELLELGVELGANHRFSRQFEAGLAYQYRRSDATDVEIVDPTANQEFDVSEILTRFTWDTRDAFNDPTSGQITKGSYEFASELFGSQLDFVRLRIQHSRFFPIRDGTVIGASLKGGVIVPIGATDSIPIQERFFNGGENSVRSFRESQLGPKDVNGNPIGGEGTTTASIELRQTLQTHVQAALFVDAGNVVQEHTDLFGFQDYRFGIGIGMRYVLPVGPIRLDAALNPDPRDGEARGAVHFSVGFSF